jgi:hypothetical protein
MLTMTGSPDSRARRRRDVLRQVATLTLGVMATSVLAACGPAAAPAPTSTPAVGPTTAPTTATQPATAAVAPTAAPAPTGAAAAAAAAPTGTLRYANADFSNESTDPINLESIWGFAMYDSLLTFDPQGNVVGNLAESYTTSAPTA